MEIYLIRHTKTDTGKGLCYGQSDVPLAASFAEEAQLIHHKLPGLTRDCKVVTSPLSRCRQLAVTFGRPVEEDCRLLELQFGDIDTGELRNWTDHFVTIPPPNGETFSDLCRRAGLFWEELLHKNESAQILVVTHAGVIRAILTHVLQLPLVNAFKFRVEAGSIHKFERLNRYTYIHYING